MGKAAFVHLSDGVSRLQIYIRKADVTGIRNDGAGDADGWALFQLLDHGDFIGVKATPFVTKTASFRCTYRSFSFCQGAGAVARQNG